MREVLHRLRFECSIVGIRNIRVNRFWDGFNSELDIVQILGFVVKCTWRNFKFSKFSLRGRIREEVNLLLNQWSISDHQFLLDMSTNSSWTVIRICFATSISASERSFRWTTTDTSALTKEFSAHSKWTSQRCIQRTSVIMWTIFFYSTETIITSDSSFSTLRIIFFRFMAFIFISSTITSFTLVRKGRIATAFNLGTV